jgi:hypothetical protein
MELDASWKVHGPCGKGGEEQQREKTGSSHAVLR